MPPLLAHALVDDYAAVRFIAHRSLETHDGFANLAYDFAAPVQRRRERMLHAVGRWTAMPRSRERRGRELYLNRDGTLDRAAIRAAITRRDKRVVDLAE